MIKKNEYIIKNQRNYKINRANQSIVHNLISRKENRSANNYITIKN